MFSTRTAFQHGLHRHFSKLALSSTSLQSQSLVRCLSQISFIEPSKNSKFLVRVCSPIRFFSSVAIPEEAVDEADDVKTVLPAEPTKKDPKDRRTVIPWPVSVEYMKSQAYRDTYGNEPVWKPYRRQHKGQIPKQHTRKTCIRHGMIITGSPCPLCRDEYLTLDFRHTALLKQFISPYTGEILKWNVTNICMRKYYRLVVELMKARYFGTMEFKTPFRHYDYSEFYNQEPGSAAEAALQNLQTKNHQKLDQ